MSYFGIQHLTFAALGSWYLVSYILLGASLFNHALSLFAVMNHKL